ncbi:hypothetical protein ACJ6WF_28970 [Streptomyces sp. MMS24-I2-30]|uniref:hypothetical protein n=1 Tax=Streptomyces sp. MMS24-I2-30 TaxID=3351564 RepID=UPI003896D212
MPADEVTHGTEVDKSRARTGPRHAVPRKPLFTRFHMPAGKAIASVAMPTAVIMGMGFTSTFALADNNDASAKASKSMTADEYKDCVTALKASPDASASPSPSGSPSASESAAPATPTSSASASASADGAKDGSYKASSSDSGSDDKATPSPSASQPTSSASGSGASGSGAATPSPSASAGGGLLGSLGSALTGILTGGAKDAGSSSSASPTPSSSASATDSADGKDAEGHKTPGDTVKDTVDKVTKSVGDTVKDTTGKVSKTVKDTTDAVDKAAGSVASPSPSAGASADDCPVASDDTGGVDNKLPVADDPWNLDASSLLLKNADYQGIVEVKCANGTTKKVLKYVISGGTDIGDLHQTVKDKDAGKTYHVQAAPGSTSTIRDGDTVMYTESISGNLFGLIPVTFSPDSPPPLNIPLIYFTHVKVVQAAQFGGSLHVPGMHVYTTD